MSFKRLTPEREKELIDRIATYIANSGFALPAEILLEVFKPVSYVTSQWGIVYLSPFLGFSSNDWDQSTQDLVRLFENEENITRIINRVHEIKEQRERANSVGQSLASNKKEALYGKIRRILLGF